MGGGGGGREKLEPKVDSEKSRERDENIKGRTNRGRLNRQTDAKGGRVK